VRDIKWSIDNLRNFVDKCGRKPIKAVVENVRDGSTVRVLLLPDFYHITLMISGIKVSIIVDCCHHLEYVDLVQE
jgi:staphylococcal nuclease domain-containing protein 1